MTHPDLDLDLGDLSEAEWISRIDALGLEHGFAQRLGPRHLGVLVESGPRLLVSFESVGEARRRPGALPRGFDQVARQGWSVLSILSRGETWFRDPALVRAFDRWTDDGFFNDFHRVLFAGSGAGGHAAAAYSVAAPGARVLALRPYATLDPSVAGWDRRHPAARRLDWTSRYGYAPELLDAAERAVTIHDPHEALDAMHAALFARPNVVPLRARHLGTQLEPMFERMGLLPLLLDAAMDGTLDAEGFARLWQARHSSAPYLRALLRRLESLGRPRLAARVCRAGLQTVDRPLFARRLGDLSEPMVPAKAAE